MLERNSLEGNAIEEFNIYNALIQDGDNAYIYDVLDDEALKEKLFYAKDQFAKTVSNYAIEKFHVDVIELFLNYDINYNEVLNIINRTILHEACVVGLDEVVSILCEGDYVDVNAQDIDGNTALHLASEGGHDDMVKTLLDNGADKTIENNEGKIAEDIARDRADIDVLNVLKAVTIEKLEILISADDDSSELNDIVVSGSINESESAHNDIEADEESLRKVDLQILLSKNGSKSNSNSNTSSSTALSEIDEKSLFNLTHDDSTISTSAHILFDEYGSWEIIDPKARVNIYDLMLSSSSSSFTSDLSTTELDTPRSK